MATTNYPASIDNYPQPNNGDTISVSDHWLAPAIVAVENELGTDPAGSFTDVKSRLDSGLIEEIDQWCLTSNYSHSGSGAADVLTANWSQFSADAFTEKGTGVTESSGIFSFPSTGYYEINYSIMISTTSNNSYFGGQIQATTNNSAYNTRGYSLTGSAGAGYYVSVMSDFIFRVADITNYKVRFIAQAAGSASFLGGGTSDLRTSVRFKKLGGL